MTEAQWLASVSAHSMLAVVRDRGSARLWRLFAVACVRAVEDQLRDVRSREALDIAERFADGAATRKELRAARERAATAAREAGYEAWVYEAQINFGIDETYLAMCESAECAEAVVACLSEEVDAETAPESLRLPGLIRELFGNPFRWVMADPLWLARNDGAARRLAESIYETGNFESMPILADALEDAGCGDDDILSHLRSPGPHVRGCWALDLVLGKS